MASNMNPVNLGHSARSLQGDFKRSSYFYWKHSRAYLFFSIGKTSTTIGLNNFPGAQK